LFQGDIDYLDFFPGLDKLHQGGKMKRFFLLLTMLIIALGIACIKEPIAMYEDVGVIEVHSDTSVVLFNVPDPDNNGWNWSGSGECSKELTIILKEKAHKDVSIDRLNWKFYDLNGNSVGSRHKDYVPPITIKSGNEISCTVSVRVNEDIADELDDATGAVDDFYGEGTIEFNVEGYDTERGNTINTIPSYTPLKVQK